MLEKAGDTTMRTEQNFHHYERTLQRMRERIWPDEYPTTNKKPKREHLFNLTPKNREILKEYLSFAERQNYSMARIIRLMFFAAQNGELLGKDFDAATKEDIQGSSGLITAIFRKWSNNSTREMNVKFIRQFYKWLLGNNEDFPEIVRGIKFRKKSGESYPKDLLTKEEVGKIIDAADHPLKKALIGLLYSTGARVGEIGLMQVRDVEFQDDEAIVHITESKTTQRKVLVVNSAVHLLRDWLSIHPLRRNPNFREMPLFVSVSHQKYGRRLEYEGIRQMLKRTTFLSGIPKPSNPHHWRHSFATHLAQDGYSEYQIKIILGHSMTSKATARYIHMAGRDVFDTIRKKNGKKIIEEDAQKPALEYKKCDTCGHADNTFNQILCNKCMRPLGISERLQYKDQLSEIRSKMENMEKAYHLLLKAHIETIGVENENK